MHDREFILAITHSFGGKLYGDVNKPRLTAAFFKSIFRLTYEEEEEEEKD